MCLLFSCVECCCFISNVHDNLENESQQKHIEIAVSEKWKMDDPRRDLAKYYDLDSEIPLDIMEKVNLRHSLIWNENASRDETKRKIIYQALERENLTLEQKESISNSILSGKHKLRYRKKTMMKRR